MRMHSTGEGATALHDICQLRLFEAPLCGLYPITVHEANQRLVEWKHRLGPCLRPFRQEAYFLELHGPPDRGGDFGLHHQWSRRWI